MLRRTAVATAARFPRRWVPRGDMGAANFTLTPTLSHRGRGGLPFYIDEQDGQDWGGVVALTQLAVRGSIIRQYLCSQLLASVALILSVFEPITYG